VSAQHLALLRELAKANPKLSQWLEDGIQRWRGGEQLDRALALAGAGAKIERNRALLRAARLLDPENEYSTWYLAGLLEFSIKRFESLIQPQIEAGTKKNLSPVDLAIHQAFLSGTEMIRSQRKLFDLLC